MFHSDEELQETPERPALVTEAFKNYPLNPSHWYNSNGKCPKGILQFAAEGESRKIGFGKDDEIANNIKRVLTLGIPLSGAMNTEDATNGSSSAAFQLYRSGIAEGACTDGNTNHQITLVGYGHYKTIPVWLFLNSWGSSWGQSGYFMVEQGANSFCTEVIAEAILPRFYGFNNGADLRKPFNETEKYQSRLDTTYRNWFNISVHRGINGMDSYDEEGNPQHSD